MPLADVDGCVAALVPLIDARRPVEDLLDGVVPDSAPWLNRVVSVRRRDEDEIDSATLRSRGSLVSGPRRHESIPVGFKQRTAHLEKRVSDFLPAHDFLTSPAQAGPTIDH